MINNGILSNINTKQIMENLNNFDTNGLFKDLGFNEQQSQKIIKGDQSPVEEMFTIEPDCDTLLMYHGQYLNKNLIYYFYKTVKEGKQFTEDEINNYKQFYDEWFNIVFDKASTFTFCCDEESNDLSIIIKVKEDYFQMSKIDDLNIIIYLDNYKS